MLKQTYSIGDEVILTSNELNIPKGLIGKILNVHDDGSPRWVDFKGRRAYLPIGTSWVEKATRPAGENSTNIENATLLLSKGVSNLALRQALFYLQCECDDRELDV